MTLRYLPVAGVVLATGVAVAACSGGGSSPAAAGGTAGASSAVTAAPATTAPPATGATPPVGPSSAAGGSQGQTATPIPPESASPEPSGYTSALAEWKLAAKANAATMNVYLLRAAQDLRAAGRPGYHTAISDLTYLGHLPDTDDTPTQRAKAKVDLRVLNKFFGTPGLLQ